MVKAIFFDIDGTLVSFKNHQIPKSTFDALYKLKEKGIKLFIATGRGKDGLDVLNDFPFDGYITLMDNIVIQIIKLFIQIQSKKKIYKLY